MNRHQRRAQEAISKTSLSKVDPTGSAMAAIKGIQDLSKMVERIEPILNETLEELRSAASAIEALKQRVIVLETQAGIVPETSKNAEQS